MIDAGKVKQLQDQNARRRQWEAMREYVREQMAKPYRVKVVFGSSKVIERVNVE